MTGCLFVEMESTDIDCNEKESSLNLWLESSGVSMCDDNVSVESNSGSNCEG